MPRLCPGCDKPMEDLGYGIDEETGRIGAAWLCRLCDVEYEERPRPPDGWRDFWRARVRAVRGAA